MVVSSTAVVQAGDLHFQAQLIWGTNDEKPAGCKFKEVDDETRKRLAELPLKWKHLYEVNRTNVVVARKESRKVAMSDKNALEVKVLDGKKVEVSLYGKKGDLVGKQTQPLPTGEILVLGGNAPNATCWLVTLKRVE